MNQITLNRQGINKYPHLAYKWLDVYGYHSDRYTFLIWDHITEEWRNIHTYECKGRDCQTRKDGSQ